MIRKTEGEPPSIRAYRFRPHMTTVFMFRAEQEYLCMSMEAIQHESINCLRSLGRAESDFWEILLFFFFFFSWGRLDVRKHPWLAGNSHPGHDSPYRVQRMHY